MNIQSLVKYNREMIGKYITKNCLIIDATCGNGHDTNYLASLSHGTFIYSFDIQAEAINNAKVLCQEHNNIKFINDGHQHLDKYVTKKINLAVFNLGYLPNSTSTLSTVHTTTIIAIEHCLKRLQQSGAVILTLYTGHDNALEASHIEAFCQELDKYQYLVLKYQFLNLKDNPYMIIIEKK